MKMTLNIRRGLLILAFLGLAFGSASQEKDVSLFGSKQGGEIRLYWETYTWPSDQAGFNLYRRTVRDSAYEDWEKLNIDPLSPDITLVEDWANQGLTDMEATEMDSTVRQYLREGNIDTAGGTGLVDLLKANNGTASGDRIRMKEDFRLALILDFAFIDHTTVDKLVYEYALVAVLDDGSEALAPSDIFSTALLGPPDYNTSFQRQIRGITFLWTLSREQFKGRAINGYFVYRRKPGETTYDQLVSAVIGSHRESEDRLLWRFNDLLADHDRDWEYGIAYQDMFQDMSTIEWFMYDADYYKRVPPPRIDSTGLVDNVHVFLSWSVPEESNDKASSFLVEIADDAEPGKWEFRTISDTLGQDIYSWIDTLPRNYGDIYFYRIALVDPYGRLWYSDQVPVFYMGLVKPRMPVGLGAKAFRKDGDPWVKLEWQANTDDSLVKGYVLYTDELIPDSLLHISAIPMVEDTKLEYRIPNLGGREYTFGVAPLSLQGAEGPMAKATIYVPVTKMPPLYTFNAVLEDNLSVTVDWEYPIFRELIGFELYMNGELIAGPDILSAEDTAFNVRKIEKAEDSRYCTFHMKAVGEGMKTDFSLPQKLYLANISLSDIMSPDSLKVELRKDTSGYYALLTWKALNLDSAAYQGYIIYADYYSEGSVHLLNSVAPVMGGRYAYQLPDALRNSYTLRVAAKSEDGTIGRYSQVKLDLNERIRSAARPLNEEEESKYEKNRNNK